MTIHRLAGAIGAAILAWSLLALAPSSASAQGAVILPEQEGPITMMGCFLRLNVPGEGEKFVLVNPVVGPATSVEKGACTATGNEPMVELDDVHTNVHKHHLDRSLVGRWIEVTGRLEKAGTQALREVHVDTYRIVPVVARVAEAPRTMPPAPKPEPAPPQVAPPVAAVQPPAAVAPVMPEELPKTASPIPLIGALGLLSLVGGAALYIARRRR